MSHQVQVSNHFGLQSFSNILRRSPLKTHLLNTKPAYLKIRLTANDSGSLSESKTTTTKNSSESPTEKNSGAKRVAMRDAHAAERKLKRQSFFEHVCGEKTERFSGKNVDMGTRLKNGHIKVNKNEFVQSIITNQSRARSSEFKKVACASSEVLPTTGEVSPHSTNSEASKKFFRCKTGFLNFPIKKSCLSKRGPHKFEFVPLANTSVSETSDCCEPIFENSFQGLGISSDIIELMDDLSRSSEGWVDLHDFLF